MFFIRSISLVRSSRCQYKLSGPSSGTSGALVWQPSLRIVREANHGTTQLTGHFFVLGTATREIRVDRAMMTTEQLPDHEIAELARTTR